MSDSREMPRYRSHKTVWALKIKGIVRQDDGSAIITPEEEGYAPFTVDAAYVQKHDPKAGGYYVQYDDGYLSFSPSGPFEAGYTRI